MRCSICKNLSKKKFSYGKIPLCDNFQKSVKKSVSQRKYELTFMGCDICHHLELDQKVDPDKIYINYPYYSKNSPDLDEHFNKYAKYLKNFKKKGTTNFHLDIGCNDGILLKKTKLYFKTFGIEPGKKQSILARKHGKIFNNFMSEELIKKKKLINKFNIITTNNTLANIKDLDDFMKAISLSLKKNGFFIIETLNLDLLFKNRVYEMFNHEHFHYFSKNSIVLLCKKYDLKFQKITYLKTKGATMRVVFRKEKEYQNNKHLYKLKKKSFFKKEINSFVLDLKKIRKNVKILFANKSNMIGGFGSSQGTTIWVHLLNIQKKINFITDDNKLRYGYYVPGTKIKVVSPKLFYKIKLNYTLIFAWRFEKIIRKKHQKNLTKKNKFLNIINFK